MLISHYNPEWWQNKEKEIPYSIRINDQYRICFKWSENGPMDVEITDYH